MWIAKFRLRHDCILGNRCRKFNVSIQGVAFSVFKEKNKILSSSMLYLSGNADNIKKFFEDLRKDKVVVKIEQKGSMCLLIEKAASRAVQFFSPKLIFVKPVLMDTEGYELWEVGSWDKETVSEFVNDTKKHIKDFKLLRMTNNKIDNVYFPKLMPKLTDKQKEVIELAIKEGYYKSPRKIGLRKLAKISKISLSTYEQHLRVAEEKLIPNVYSYSE